MITSNKLSLFSFCFILVAFIAAGCATTGSTDYSTKVYAEDYDTMVSTVEQAILTSRLTIQEMHENEDETKFEYIFTERVTMDGEVVTGKLIRAIIEKKGDNEVSLQIINPEYHFTVPNDQRVNYRRMLMDKVDNYLAEA